MKPPIIQLIAITAAFITLSSCSSMEDAVILNPSISNLGDTGCLSHRGADNVNSRGEIKNGSFEMIFEGQVARCKFTSLEYPCDYGRVNIMITYNDGIMTIIEYPDSDTADCLCETDASFTIENIPQNDFTLKIYHGDSQGNYDNTSPKYEGQIKICNDKLLIRY